MTLYRYPWRNEPTEITPEEMLEKVRADIRAHGEHALQPSVKEWMEKVDGKMLAAAILEYQNRDL